MRGEEDGIQDGGEGEGGDSRGYMVREGKEGWSGKGGEEQKKEGREGEGEPKVIKGTALGRKRMNIRLRITGGGY